MILNRYISVIQKQKLIILLTQLQKFINLLLNTLRADYNDFAFVSNGLFKLKHLLYNYVFNSNLILIIEISLKFTKIKNNIKVSLLNNCLKAINYIHFYWFNI